MKKYRLYEGMTEADGADVTVYGVVLPDGRVIEDVTFEKKSAERLVGLLNDNGVELCHASDVIEDYLFNETTLTLKRYGE